VKATEKMQRNKKEEFSIWFCKEKKIGNSNGYFTRRKALSGDNR
jgi:hypothetical protein